jgi:hypothetical protein
MTASLYLPPARPGGTARIKTVDPTEDQAPDLVIEIANEATVAVGVQEVQADDAFILLARLRQEPSLNLLLLPGRRLRIQLQLWPTFRLCL